MTVESEFLELYHPGSPCDSCEGFRLICPSCGHHPGDHIEARIGCIFCSNEPFVECPDCDSCEEERGEEVLQREAEMQKAVKDLVTTPHGRRLLSIHSPVFFDTYYCDMDYSRARERWLNTHNRIITDAKSTKRKGKLVQLAPRDHGKTQAFATTCTRAICIDRNERVIWGGANLTSAKERVGRIQSLLLSPRIQEDWCSAPDDGFGPFLTGNKEGTRPNKIGGEKWTDSVIYVNRTVKSVDPTLKAIGAGGTLTGAHPTLGFFDDLEDDRTVYTAARRARTRAWLKGTIDPMFGVGSAQLYVGTRKHEDDLYAHQMKDPTFEVLEDRAIIKEPESFEYTYKIDENGRKSVKGIANIRGEYEVLWPEKRPLEHLLLARLSAGNLLFAREYQNQVQDDGSAIVKWSDLEAAQEIGEELCLYDIPDVPGLVICQAWDFALVTDAERAERQDSDYTVGITWGRDNDGNRYLLGLWRERGMSPAQYHHAVKEEYKKFAKRGYPPQAVIVEHNAFGELHYMGLRKSTDLPIIKHHTTQKKADPWQGVPSLSVLFENEKVCLPYSGEDTQKRVRVLCQELWGFGGSEPHDDTVLALWMAEIWIRKESHKYLLAASSGITYEDTGAGVRAISDTTPTTHEEAVERRKKAAEKQAEIEAESVWGQFDFSG